MIEHEVQDYPGLASHPFTWEDAVQKFDALVAGRVDKGLSGEIKDAARIGGKHPGEGLDETARLRQGGPRDVILMESSLIKPETDHKETRRDSNGNYIRQCSRNL